MSLDIAVLVVGEPPAELRDRYPGYDAMLAQLLRAGDESLRFTSYAVRDGVFPLALDDHDGYLITGSRHGAYEELPWIARLAEFVRELDARRKPLVGVCFGHQLIARALGGRVERAAQGWGVGIQRASIAAAAPWMDPGVGDFALVASHQDQVVELPARAQRLAGSAFCPIAMYRIADHVFALQSHPEFSREYSRDLMDSRRRLIAPERIASGMASLSGELDSPAVGRWMLAFLRHAAGVAG